MAQAWKELTNLETKLSKIRLQLNMFSDKKSAAFEKIRKFHQLLECEISALEVFVALLLKFNEQYNLIGKSTIDDLWNRHILDCAQLINYIENKNFIVGDFGSGAGFPALILSILGIKEIHLIEKSFRKCQFLQEAKKFSPNQVIIHNAKIEDLKLQNLKFDIITSRAFAPLNRLLPAIKPFAKKETIGILLKGRNLNDELILAKKTNKFNYSAFPSITEAQSNVLIIKNFS